MRILSLFSGIGAFEKALERLQAPYELVNYCEIDKYASKAYSLLHNISENKNLGDITKVDETKLNDFDLMTWGFPCQDISIAGKQQGIKQGTRSGLYYEGLRILKHKQPKYSIIENVKALTSSKFKDTFEQILKDLDECGYNNYWQVLNAKDYGVPQNRERVFIISIRKDVDNGHFLFPNKFDNGVRLKDILDDLPIGKGLKEFKNIVYKKNYIQWDNTGKGYNSQHARAYFPNKYLGTLNTKEIKVLINDKVRDLTPLERMRITGFDDIDYEKIKDMSKTTINKMTGNSIVVDVLYYIFINLLKD